MSAALLIAVNGNTQRMIPLFAIGVFTGFTLSQTGLVVHWWRERPSGWTRRAIINGLGAAVTGVATAIFLLTKFTEGAWVVVIAVPLFILLFVRIHSYYARVAQLLGYGTKLKKPEKSRTRVIVPLVAVSRLAERALSEALSLGQEVVAVTVVFDGAEGDSDREQEIHDEWQRWNPGVPLKVLHTQYASVVEPIVAFIDEISGSCDDQIVVLIPVIVPSRFRHRLLHNHMDSVLTAALRTRTDLIVARVVMPLEE
jgi:uncharacterized membrane protein